MNDWLDQSASADAELRAEREERERRTIAELLVTRGAARAAALLAISGYRTDQVDNWNGGQFEAVLSVPPEQFDLVSGDIREKIDAAARVVVGERHYAGLQVEVRLSTANPGWDRALLEWLRDASSPFVQPTAIEGARRADD